MKRRVNSSHYLRKTEFQSASVKNLVGEKFRQRKFLRAEILVKFSAFSSTEMFLDYYFQIKSL